MSQETNYSTRFIAEAREHIASMSAAMISLEREAANPQPSVEQLLRAVHSIKGGAGFTGLKNIERLAHAMEEAIENIRDGHVAVSPEAIDVLLAVLDRIIAMVDDLEHSDTVDIAELLARLRPLIVTGDDEPEPEAGQSNSVSGSAQSVASAPADSEFVLSKQVLAAWQPSGAFLFGVKLDWLECERALSLSPQEVALRVERSGTVHDARTRCPDPGLASGLPNSHAWLLVVISSPQPLEAFRSALDIPCAMVVQLHSGSAPSGQQNEAATSPAPKPRTPPTATSLRVSVPLIDHMMALAGELVLVRNQALRSAEPASSPLRRLFRRLDAVTNELQDAALRMRTQPVGTLFDRFPRMVRDLARQLGKQIDVTISGSEVELDKTILELLTDPLTHLIRNCCDHGIEPPERRTAQGKPAGGGIWLSARQERGQIVIEVRDDGRGIDPEAVKRKAIEQEIKRSDELARMTPSQVYELILLSGFSTASKVTDVSGRGVGMDVVKTNVDRVGGAVEIDSSMGRGTVFTLRLPLTLAIMPCLLVECGGRCYAVPQRDIEEIVLLGGAARQALVERDHDGEVLRLRDRLLPVVRLGEIFGHRDPLDPKAWADIADRHRTADADAVSYGAVIRLGSKRFVLVFDRVQQSENIVVKPLPPLLRPLGIYAATTILGDGSVAMILNSEGIARHAQVLGRLVLDVPSASSALLGSAAVDEVMLFRYGPEELLGISMKSIRRVVIVDPENLQRVGDRELVTIDGAAINVLRIDRQLGLSRLAEPRQCYLILPRVSGTPVGLLASEIVDTATVTAELDRLAYQADGVLGSTMIKGEIALFLDMSRLIELWEIARQRALPAHHPATPARVLVIDDTAFFRKLVAEHLRSGGYEVEVADNGSDGLDRLRQGQFDAVVSDVEMPVMDGLTFARNVRADARVSATPLLALTTLNTPESRAAAKLSGFDAYEVKLDRNSLLTAVAGLLSGRPAAAHGGGAHD